MQEFKNGECCEFELFIKINEIKDVEKNNKDNPQPNHPSNTIQPGTNLATYMYIKSMVVIKEQDKENKRTKTTRLFTSSIQINLHLKKRETLLFHYQ